MHGWAAAQKGFSEGDRVSRDDALRLAREALSIDPRCGAALRTLVFAQFQHIYFNTAASPAETCKDGIDAAALAISIDGGDHVAYLYKGGILFLTGQQEVGLADVRHAHALNPNDAFALASLGFYEAMSGEQDRGIAHITLACRLSPRDPIRPVFLNLLAWAYFAASDYVKGAEAAQRAVSEAPSMPAPRMCLMLNRVGLREIGRARADFQILNGLAPELVQSRLAGVWISIAPDYKRRATTFMRVAAGLEDPSAAGALR